MFVLDRKRRNYDRLNRDCRLLLRFAVAGQMFTYGIDVPVKLFSFHLILMSLILLAPEFRRLTNFLVFNRWYRSPP